MTRLRRPKLRESFHGRKFSRILLKNFLLVILPTLIPLVLIASAVYRYNTANIREEIKAADIGSLEGTRSVGDMIAAECDKISARVAADGDTMILMSYNRIEPAMLQSRFQNLYKIMDFIGTANQFVRSVYVYFENSRFVFSTNYDSMGIDYFADSDWVRGYLARKNTNFYWEQARITDSRFSQQGQTVISSFRPVHNYGQDSVVVVNLDDRELGKIIDGSGTPGRSLMIVDPDGVVLYHTDLSLVTRNVRSIDGLSGIDCTRTQSFFVRRGGETDIVSVVKSDYNDWRYVSVTPVSRYSRLTEELVRFLTIALVVCFLIAAAISVVISIRLYQPVQNMAKLFGNREDWDEELGSQGKRGFDEFKFLTRSITRSFDREREMKVTLENRLSLLHKAQSIALQAQINPHFLYNTLETINWKAMSLTHGENEVSVMIGDLSKLLRLSLETENSLTTVREEIEHAKYYLEIQKMRFANLFEVVWDIDPSICRYRAVKLSLQPIVENAIYHGVKPKGEHGVITITGTEASGAIELSVTDNGVGMLPEETARLNAQMKGDYIKENEHIGLWNVNQRIKLLFGETYGISVESVRDVRTRVTLRFPKEAE